MQTVPPTGPASLNIPPRPRVRPPAPPSIRARTRTHTRPRTQAMGPAPELNPAVKTAIQPPPQSAPQPQSPPARPKPLPRGRRPSRPDPQPDTATRPEPLTARGVPAPAVWSDEQIFDDGDEFFTALCNAIDDARETIELETYIFDQDELGKRVLMHLSRAARRGVKVRMLLDGAGASQWTEKDARKCGRMGIDVRFFHPLPWQRSDFRVWDFLTIRRMALGMYKLNHRNHRKCCVIDGTKAFVGSMNVSARHLRSCAGADAWRDTSVRVEGRSVFHLVDAFDTAWKFSTDYFCALRRRMRILSPINWVRLNHSEFQAKFYRHHLIQSLNRAKKRIWITNPYFVPDRRLLRALVSAAKRGVDVRVLFPDKSDFAPVKYASQSFYEPLLRAGVKIFEYRPSILHAKVLLIDDVGIVGSSNLNHRSIFRDLEADVILSNPDNVRKLQARFREDLKQSRRVRRQDWRKRSPIIKFLERLFLIFRGIL